MKFEQIYDGRIRVTKDKVVLGHINADNLEYTSLGNTYSLKDTIDISDYLLGLSSLKRIKELGD